MFGLSIIKTSRAKAIAETERKYKILDNVVAAKNQELTLQDVQIGLLKLQVESIAPLQKEVSEKAAKIEELTLKLYLQTLELKEINAEREELIYNRRDNHGCFLRNKK
jgi:hypothetical protein